MTEATPIPELRCLALPRRVRIRTKLAVAAALLASLGLPRPSVAFDTPTDSFRAEQKRLLAELTAIRAGLLRAVASCREQTDRAGSARATCGRAEVRLREALALEAELRTLPETAPPIDRALAPERLAGWSDALERLRAEPARAERPRVGHTPAGAAPPPAGPIATGELGAITGQVTDGTTGDPLQDVLVRVYNRDGNVASSVLTDAGGNYATPAELKAGPYFARTFVAGFVEELYDDIPCPFFGSCDPTTGTPIAVTGGGTTSGIDFALDPGGAITGTATETGTSAPIAGVLVFIWNAAGTEVDVSVTDETGVYTTSTGLTTGSYFAATLDQSRHLNELYDDIPCPFFGFCDPTTGTPIAVTQGATTSGIDFVMAPGGSIAGSITDAATGDPIRTFVSIIDGTGNNVSSSISDALGNYVSEDGLPTGTYFVRTQVPPGHVSELYDDIPCAFFTCDPVTGTPVAVTAGRTTPGIDLALTEGGNIAGEVTEEAGNAPISSVLVGFFDGAGDLLFMWFVFDGSYETFDGIPAGTYFSRTLNGEIRGYADERFDELPCLQTCPVTQGTPITVAAGATTAGVDFTLPVRPLFFDSLESGGLGFWSSVAGGVACAHSICTTGGPLSAGCDPCAGAICAVDPSCCTDQWDGFCLSQIRTVCELECP